MTEARVIAEVTARTGYDGMQLGFRLRAEELKLRREDVDMLGNLADGHASKILAAYPLKAIGRTTLGPMLHALKAKLLLVPDDDVIWKEKPIGRRINRPVMLHAVEHGLANMPDRRTVVREILRRRANKALKKARRMRNEKVTPKQRSRIAKHAANARWRKPKVTEISNETKKTAILEQERAKRGADCRPRPDAHQPARAQGLDARPGKHRPQAQRSRTQGR